MTTLGAPFPAGSPLTRSTGSMLRSRPRLTTFTELVAIFQRPGSADLKDVCHLAASLPRASPQERTPIRHRCPQRNTSAVRLTVVGPKLPRDRAAR